MDTGKFLESAKRLESEKKGDHTAIDHFRKHFERFHILNRSYLDKETFEKNQETISQMAETMVETIRYIDGEIAHLRSRRMKLPVDNLTLNEMQKTQTKNEALLKEFVQELEKT